MKKILVLSMLLTAIIGYGQEEAAFCDGIADFHKAYKKQQIEPVYEITETAVVRMVLEDAIDTNFKLFGSMNLFKTHKLIFNEPSEMKEEFKALLFAYSIEENPEEIKEAMAETFIEVADRISNCSCKKSKDPEVEDNDYIWRQVNIWDCGRRGNIELILKIDKYAKRETMVLLFDQEK